MFGKFVLRNDATQMEHKVGDKAVFLRRERLWNSIYSDAHLSWVESHVSNRYGRFGMTAGSANNRVKARQQFVHLEGLGQIIVGPGIDTLDPFTPFPSRG